MIEVPFEPVASSPNGSHPLNLAAAVVARHCIHLLTHHFGKVIDATRNPNPMSAAERDAQGTGVSAWSYLKRHRLQGSGLVLQVNARAQMAHYAEIAEAGFLSDFTNRRCFDGLARFDRARRQLHAGVRMSKNQDADRAPRRRVTNPVALWMVLRCIGSQSCSSHCRALIGLCR